MKRRGGPDQASIKGAAEEKRDGERRSEREIEWQTPGETTGERGRGNG